MKITSKLISVCDCEWKKCHSYCATAFVLRTQKIYCKDCYTYFYLYVKSQRLFTGELLTDIAIYLIRFVVVNCLIYGVFILDKYLKSLDAKRDYENSLKNPKMPASEKQMIDKIYNEGVDNVFIMVPLIVVLTLITAWFFYLRFFISFMKRKKVVWVEV